MQQEPPPLTKPGESTLRGIFLDAATLIASGTIVGVTASNAGPVATGVATAAVSLPFLYAFGNTALNLFASKPLMEGRNSWELTGEAFKNSSRDMKLMAILLGVTTFIGACGWAFADMARQAKIEAQARREELARRPVVPPQTIIKTDITRASDLCVNTAGDPLPAGTQVPFVLDGKNVKVICPTPQ